ncbi:hypothetical protein [Actinoplanes sp. TFC3]|nr:hypothetical protein [Actinoplanes sp. TFC3]
MIFRLDDPRTRHRRAALLLAVWPGMRCCYRGCRGALAAAPPGDRR